jgi:hypothetical protein
VRHHVDRRVGLRRLAVQLNEELHVGTRQEPLVVARFLRLVVAFAVRELAGWRGVRRVVLLHRLEHLSQRIGHGEWQCTCERIARREFDERHVVHHHVRVGVVPQLRHAQPSQPVKLGQRERALVARHQRGLERVAPGHAHHARKAHVLVEVLACHCGRRRRVFGPQRLGVALGALRAWPTTHWCASAAFAVRNSTQRRMSSPLTRSSPLPASATPASGGEGGSGCCGLSSPGAASPIGA